MLHDPLFFAAIAAFTIAVYVVADGFDLGVGILFLVAPEEHDRRVMMASLEPVWDGNETWLVMGGTLLWAAFPAAYYVLLPAFYLPVMVMLAALVLRGFAFAFREQARGTRRIWDWIFALGSLLATLAQGMILGAFIGGVPMEAGMFAGTAGGVLGALCGLGLAAGYALLAAGWLIWRTDGGTQLFARRAGRLALLGAAGMIALVSAWTAWSQPEVAQRWFTWPAIAWLSPVPVLTGLAVVATWRSIASAQDGRCFLMGIVIFLLGFVGLIVSLWPYVVPRHLTIWDAAADRQSLGFIGVGLVVVLPIVLAYQAHAYWVFRGKVTVEAAED